MSEAMRTIDEIWMPVPGYETYNVSSLGRVRGPSGREVKPFLQKKGYKRVSLFKNNCRKHFLVHRLVLLAFVGPSDLQVDHIDMVTDNNRLENLRYVTERENARSRYAAMNRSLPQGVSECCGKYRAHITHNRVRREIGRFNTPEEAGLAFIQAELKILEATP